ncbi:P-type conjugative transfer protein TrbJ [Gilliamella sp. HK2]|jgi:type IV secretion system protein TrbJ|uniref:P-type conjugative transfer protein TrbJ n=1 Tax=unclassified Gilliamella TaxID=2685620 RepID=UPI00080DFFDC|nr:P-type conjugative transfer protein TrbJ [Gilliamella apicola]OCG28977.1 P-type conjugative transfer protein TrbJ [Gilliamella apicola]OCG31425.1 P-type conjugative transfer protein TrbJ [Gilliamella apicola]OCG31458.1 P-type conjugative transfer protein TrbJ [Gilliamella apicola]
MKRIANMIILIFALNINLSSAGIPVIDAGNLAQNILSAMEAINQTLKQIEQYETQLQQYENQLRNTAGPAFEIWDKANQTIDNLNNAMKKLEYYQNQIGSFEQYLDKFKNVNSYRTMPCINDGKCTAADLENINKINEFNIESTRKSQEAAFVAIRDQQKALNNDAKQLTRLQNAVRGADGQMAALQYSNQLASNQANQLMQMRALLVSQYNALITKEAAENNKNAQELAISKKLRAASKLGNSSASKGMLGMLK